MSDLTTLPPAHQLFPARTYHERQPQLFNENRVSWLIRNRERNGLARAGAVFKTAAGDWVVNEPVFLAVFLGLAGRNKPRRLRAKPHRSRAS